MKCEIKQPEPFCFGRGWGRNRRAFQACIRALKILQPLSMDWFKYNEDKKKSIEFKNGEGKIETLPIQIEQRSRRCLRDAFEGGIWRRNEEQLKRWWLEDEEEEPLASFSLSTHNRNASLFWAFRTNIPILRGQLDKYSFDN